MSLYFMVKSWLSDFTINIECFTIDLCEEQTEKIVNNDNLCIFFYVPLKTDIYTGLEQHEGEKIAFIYGRAISLIIYQI